MIFTEQKVEDLIELVRKRYPDWNGFDHPDFMEDEVACKRETIKKARGLLSERELRRLTAEKGEPDC